MTTIAFIEIILASLLSASGAALFTWFITWQDKKRRQAREAVSVASLNWTLLPESASLPVSGTKIIAAQGPPLAGAALAIVLLCSPPVRVQQRDTSDLVLITASTYKIMRSES